MTQSTDPRWLAMQEALAAATHVIDLGCGAHPVAHASVAVDAFRRPEQRALGAGAEIDPGALAARGVRFVEARIDRRLPFADRTFDFAYCAHAIEHVDDPVMACNEMMRVATAGAIIAPSVFADVAFGRPYHRWLVMDGPGSLFFFEKRPGEDRPFGNHPNPFDVLLNDGDWSPEPVSGSALVLRTILRDAYYEHRPCLESIFLWRDPFNVSAVRRS